ncbi:hypothetical protein MY11210_009689 [Beauveria gryllotalpidicola]
MKAVSAVLISLAASAMAMPPQRLERRLAVTDDEWSKLWEDGCSKAVTTARDSCKKGDEGKIDCDEVGRKAGTKCLIEAVRPKFTDESRHKECSEPAVQGVEDCMNAEDNGKPAPQCQRAQLDTYLQCTIVGPGTPTTPQDIEYDDIWSKTCLKLSLEANEKCRKIEQDDCNKCERERNDNDMQCLLDNAKARAESDSSHKACSASAIDGMNECFSHSEGKTLPQCQREQWNAYPECVKNEPQNAAATEPAKEKCESTS